MFNVLSTLMTCEALIKNNTIYSIYVFLLHLCIIGSVKTLRTSVSVRANTSVYLQVGDSHSSDHPEHDQEHASDYRLRDGDEHGTELPKESQQDHEEASRLEDQPASNLVAFITNQTLLNALVQYSRVSVIRFESDSMIHLPWSHGQGLICPCGAL